MVRPPGRSSSISSTEPTRSCIRRACGQWRRPTSVRNAPRSARFETAVGELLTVEGADRAGFLDEIARRWSDVDEPARTQGIARDVVLLHIATMTNLFAALGWTLAQLALDPRILARVAAGDAQLLERCALESTRIGQCSLMSRTVMNELVLDTGTTRYHVSPGVTIATMLALTNTTAAPGLDRYDPDRWEGRRLRDEGSLPTRESVATFGYGPHRCPAQRFSLSAITRTVASPRLELRARTRNSPGAADRRTDRRRRARSRSVSDRVLAPA